MYADLPDIYRRFLVHFISTIDQHFPSGRAYEWQLPTFTNELFPPTLMRAALNALIKEGLIIRIQETKPPSAISTVTDEPGRGTYYEASDRAVEIVHGGLFSHFSGSDNAADAWEPLPLDRETPEAAEALQTIEELFERIRGENGFAVTEPQRYAAVTWSLRTGLEMLRAQSPTRDQVRSVVLSPIKWIITTFSGAALGECGKRAAAALIRWLPWAS